jgi:protein disulfide-isomerase A1
MIKQTLPAVTLVTPENFESFSKSDKVVIVGFFDADDATSNQTFTEVANTLRDDFLFGATNDKSLAKAEGVKNPAVVMYKTFDEGKTVHTGPFEQAPLQAWAKESAVPLMGEITPDTYSGYMESGIPLAYLFVENEADKKRIGEALTPVAAKFHGKVNFATIDAVAFGGHASNLNLYPPSFACY